MGTPKSKIIVGLATYGRSFTLANPSQNGMNAATSGGGKAGEYTREAGFLAYYEVCDMLKQGASYYWDDEQAVPYAVHGDQWVGFDDELSIRNKVKWLIDNDYGGAMVWALDMDDFKGICTPKKYPLIKSMAEGLFNLPPSPSSEWLAIVKTAQARPAAIAAASTSVANNLLAPVAVAALQAAIGANGSGPLAIDLNQLKNIPGLNVTALPGLAQNQTTSNARIVCYYTNWSHKRPGLGKFGPETLDPTLCTHIIYAFYGLKDGKLVPTEEVDNDGETALYKRVVAIKQLNPNLRVMLAVGGWMMGYTPFRQLTENAYRQTLFTFEVIEFLRKHNFDGLDLCWEFPRGQDDKEKFSKLVQVRIQGHLI